MKMLASLIQKFDHYSVVVLITSFSTSDTKIHNESISLEFVQNIKNTNRTQLIF